MDNSTDLTAHAMRGTSWCMRADEIFGVDGLHVLEVTTRDDGVLVLDVESDQTLTGCPDCGVVAVGHGRRVQVLHDAPSFARAVRTACFLFGATLSGVDRVVERRLFLLRSARVGPEEDDWHGQ